MSDELDDQDNMDEDMNDDMDGTEEDVLSGDVQKGDMEEDVLSGDVQKSDMDDMNDMNDMNEDSETEEMLPQNSTTVTQELSAPLKTEMPLDNKDTKEDKASKFLSDSKFWGFIIAVALVAFASSIVIARAVKTEFYETLEKPKWAPSPPIIATIWIILYLLIAYATYRAYTIGDDSVKSTLIWIFIIQLAMNFLWVFVFFGLKNPRAARIVIILLLLMIMIQGIYMYGIDKTAGALFLPYFIWVLFMTYLNFEIVRLNTL